MIAAQLSNFLYQNIVKPTFFKLDPEFIHENLSRSGEVFGSNIFSKKIIHQLFNYTKPQLGQVLDGIYFPNPVGLAAGFDYNAQLTSILAEVGFGWQTIGTVTYQAYGGNPKPRLVRLPDSKSLIVNKGLKGPGSKVIANKIRYHHFDIPVGISIASTNKLFQNSHEQLLDIVKSYKVFESTYLHHSYYEMNISCPNTFGGEPFTSPDRLQLLLSILDKLNLSRPLYLKMPADLSDKQVLALLKVANNHNVQGVIMSNLWKDRKHPPISSQDRDIWTNFKGNLSGKPTWDQSNHLVALTRKKYPHRFTIVGTGGIFSGEDALEKLELGADLVQLITGMIYQGPQLIGQINQHLATSWKPKGN